MNKKYYQRPAIKTLHLTEESSILAASEQDAPVLRISDDDEIKGGYVDAKSNDGSSLWDE